jgi:outer membrane protein assembly factor BamB
MTTDRADNDRYRLAVRVAAVAGLFAFLVAALLLYDYTRRLVKDPLDSNVYKALLADVDQQPTNDALKTQLRQLDAELRHEYFRQRTFTTVGAGLLVFAVVIFLIAAKTAATLNRPLPSPAPLPAPTNRDAASKRAARWAVAAVAATMLVAGALAALTQVQPSATPSVPLAPSVASAPAALTPSPETPISDEEVAKMWPRFRGPGGAGVSAYTNIPEAWDGKAGKGILWKTTVPLPGNNSPIVWGKRIFLSGADERNREVFCFEADGGKLLWRKSVPGTPQSTASVPKVLEATGFAAPTTASDGRRVFAIFANGDLAAFDFAGNLVWSKSLGIPESSYGHASSLVIFKNLLLVQFDQGSVKSSKSKLFAFDVQTGNIVWQVPRPVPNSWSTPIVIRAADRDQIVATGDPWVIAYDLSKGTEIWRVNCLATDIGPSPVCAEGRVYVANDNSELSAMRANGRGDATATAILWKGEDGMPDTCSPLATRDFLFLLTSYGTLTCYDAEKGGVLWSEEFEEAFAASPSLVGNHVYLIARSGKAWIVDPSREKCIRVAEADLGEECATSPAFQNGRIYLRGKDHLICIGK